MTALRADPAREHGPGDATTTIAFGIEACLADPRMRIEIEVNAIIGSA